MNFGRTRGIDGWGIERSASELGGRRNKGERVEMVGKSREAGGRSSGGGDREGGGDALVKGKCGCDGTGEKSFSKGGTWNKRSGWVAG